eukprot:TRINITY_DN454_c1_g3_i1.p1 TRINITY_DN454_c1_g3~~TRINITY_DN454_c1_g3_i1.p1  ORF type:complete len:235 (+),score=83.81 TRINITY_DN454_c1_g3_i1:44-748(+)
MNRDGYGSKPGSGGVASGSLANVDRRERLRLLALETIDLAKDPYFMKNHLGSYECKLCLTLHNTEGNYLAHTQGKRHKTNLSRRAAKEARFGGQSTTTMALKKKIVPKKKTIKIGFPGYKITKQNDPSNEQYSLLFEIDYPEIAEGLQPRHRLMSCFEQKKEPPNKNFRYILFAAEPYETIAFKIPSWEIERDIDKKPIETDWDRETLRFTLQLSFKPGAHNVNNNTTDSNNNN